MSVDNVGVTNLADLSRILKKSLKKGSVVLGFSSGAIAFYSLAGMKEKDFEVRFCGEAYMSPHRSVKGLVAKI